MEGQAFIKAAEVIEEHINFCDGKNLQKYRERLFPDTSYSDDVNGEIELCDDIMDYVEDCSRQDFLSLYRYIFGNDKNVLAMEKEIEG